MELVEKMLSGNQLALARLITLLENRADDLPEIMRTVYPHTGNAYCLGVTGPPGAGKSTLVDELTSVMRQRGLTVGIVAVDPTSPFTGGALLGDRIRMQKHYLDDDVFIRSLATRGSYGGLSASAKCIVKALDAFGKDVIIVETVGVGQTELEIIEAVDTILVVMVPEAGDTIQTMKAGLMEIADIFAVNKADREGATQMAAELRAMLSGRQIPTYWEIPVIETEASNSIGIEELYAEIEHHREVLSETDQLSARRRKQREGELIEIVQRRIKEQIIARMKKEERFSSLVRKIADGEIDPYSASNEIFSDRALLQDCFQ